MRKISTLAFMAFFCCMSAMAQVVLGDIKFSIKDGAKLNPTTGKITVTFPDVTGVEDPTATNFVLAGAFNDIDFDGVEGSFASGVTFDLGEFELQAGKDYTLSITSVKVDDAEVAAEGGYKLNFKTRGAERKMSWTFTMDEESVTKIKADENAETNETAGIGQFWSVITADQRHYIHQKLTGSEIMLDANTPLPMTEDLYFNINADKVYVGDVVDTKYKNNLVFNANALQIIIPDCQEGDVITFKGCKYATKPSASKFPVIVALNGAALAPDGLVSSSGLKDSIDVPKNSTNLRFEVQVAGDVTFSIGQCNLSGISIEAGVEKKPCKYNVVAAYTEDEETTTLKELVGETQGVTGSTVKVTYPYWVVDAEGNQHFAEDESRFVTELLKVTYYVAEDNSRKSNKLDPNAALNRALARHPKIAKKYGKFIKNHKAARGLFMLFFGKKKISDTAFPTKFPYIKKTDQERCENMTWVLNDKTPFIVTQKCDGSSGTYILARTHKVFGKKFEFYVCSRNVRQLTPDQKSFYEDNYYWECAIKYDIETKLKDYLEKHPELDYVCWQGEVCAPSIQSNPHGLTETHLFCFHMIDSVKGKYDMREAIKIWKDYGMETVPVVDENYILPDDFESFKLSADGFYDASVCEGKTKQTREGFVYYKTTDPAFSFKNVSRTYLLKHNI